MKKGIFNLTTEIPVWLFRIMVLILVLVVLFIGVWIHLTREINVSEYESQVISYNVLSCISYTDGKNYLGTIDKSKIPFISDCINSKDIAFKFLLKYLDGTEEEYFFNENDYKVHSPLCGSNLENKIYKYCNELKYYVLVNNNEPAFIEFNILQKDLGGGS